MKFVALVSGGKDSIASILECQRQGHVLVACIHLAKPSSWHKTNDPHNAKEEEEESYMYQSAASEAIETLVTECIGVPLVCYPRTGRSVNTSLVYQEPSTDPSADPSADAVTVQDEVEDLYHALVLARAHVSFDAVSSGAILSTYQRVRIEQVCSRLQLTSLSFLWRRLPQSALLQYMLTEHHLQAVLVRVAAPPGLTVRHLQQSLADLSAHFRTLHDKYQFHECGEGGEYETLVLDCPGLYRQRLVLDEVAIVEMEHDGVGNLLVKQCHAEMKEDHGHDNPPPFGEKAPVIRPNMASIEHSARMQQRSPSRDSQEHQLAIPLVTPRRRTLTFFPKVRRVPGGLWHVAELMAPAAATVPSNGPLPNDEVPCAVEEARYIFDLLRQLLHQQDCTPQDVLMVHLYLSEISHFGAINQHYRSCFGTLLPPSRSCVAVGQGILPGGRRVLLDCLVQCGSGAYMRTVGQEHDDHDHETTTTTSPTSPSLFYASAARVAHRSSGIELRRVLHVQSLSHWAPVCVGPYSQVNTYKSCVHFCAGQIGLVPASMTLRPTWTEQLQQAWTNVASVLDALQAGSLDHLLSGLVYVANSVLLEDDGSVASAVLNQIDSVCRTQREQNAGILAGAIDGIIQHSQKDFFDGYEDEGTMLEEFARQGKEPPTDLPRSFCPLLLISVAEMPVGALIELEVIAATSSAASSLGINHSPGVNRQSNNSSMQPSTERSFLWEAGYDPIPTETKSQYNAVTFDINLWTTYLGAGMIASSTVTGGISSTWSPEGLHIDIDSMFHKMLSLLFDHDNSSMSVRHCLHLRLYYDATCSSDNRCDDGILLRSSFQAAISAIFGADAPVFSVVPVHAIRVLHSEKGIESDSMTLFGLQALFVDPVSTETDYWVHHGRRTG